MICATGTARKVVREVRRRKSATGVWKLADPLRTVGAAPSRASAHSRAGSGGPGTQTCRPARIRSLVLRPWWGVPTARHSSGRKDWHLTQANRLEAIPPRPARADEVAAGTGNNPSPWRAGRKVRVRSRVMWIRSGWRGSVQVSLTQSVRVIFNSRLVGRVCVFIFWQVMACTYYLRHRRPFLTNNRPPLRATCPVSVGRRHLRRWNGPKDPERPLVRDRGQRVRVRREQDRPQRAFVFDADQHLARRNAP